MNVSADNHIEIKVGERVITVHRLTLPMSIRQGRLLAEVEKEPLESFEAQMVREYFFPPMVACSTGDLPTDMEFIEIPVSELSLWYDTVDRLNPGLLPPSSAPTKKDSDEKKES